MSRISDALSAVQNAANSAAEAVKITLGFAPTVAKTTAVVQVPMGSNSEVAQQANRDTVVQKSRFERFTNFARNNPATSIAMLASAIFAVVYGVDKYLQNRQLKNLENHLGSAGDLDQFPGASQIAQDVLAQDLAENCIADTSITDGIADRKQLWNATKHAYRNTLENVDEPFVGAAKIAKQLNLAEQVELAKLVKTNPDLAFAYAANLPDAADAVAAEAIASKKFVEEISDESMGPAHLEFDGNIKAEVLGQELENNFGTAELNANAFIKEALDHEAFKVDDRFYSSPRMTGRGDIYGEAELGYATKALDQHRQYRAEEFVKKHLPIAEGAIQAVLAGNGYNFPEA
jgi:hypothetical protein